MTHTHLQVRRWATATVVSLGLALSTLAASPASADEASDAPVTAPDAVTLWVGPQGGFQSVNVLANDSDPQGDELQVCRVAETSSRHVMAVASGGTLMLGAMPRAKPGTYQVTYYACDLDYLTPGTLTVTVKKVKPVRVTKIAGRPGKLRVVNPNERKVVVLWGGKNEKRPDGRLGLAAGKRAVITVKRERILWIAYIPRIFVLAGEGTVRNITLPKRADRAGAERTVPLAPRVQKLWDAQR
ncbi:Ig-like domain-containing protein [Nocardioides lijunqiniae]|uniref:Ig-like domain-containing protein n=1 Tax=Nocardioides lijunqiniae TaxID=2760832 RepID=UPI001878CDB4|nr:Ig-like domain-containing protein [Nocardioides lijunqiniae]